MIKLIVGNKGSGKTKALIQKVGEAIAVSKGNVVCVEKGPSLRYDISHKVRLIEADDYDISGFAEFHGFLAGILAGNYDITDLFVDGTFKIGGKDYNAFAEMIEKLAKVSDENNTIITFTVSCDPSDLPESMKKYIV